MLGSTLALTMVALAGSLFAVPFGVRGWSELWGRLGQGFFLGVIVIGWCAVLFERAGIILYAWPLAGAVLVASLFAAKRLAPVVPRGGVGPRAWAGALLMVLVVAHFAFATGEAAHLPVFPWDAWSTWLYRARAMFLEPGAAFVAPTAWDILDHGTYELEAARYPIALSAAFVWLARLHGTWSDPVVLIAWPLAWLALVAVFNAALRGAGIAGATATLLTAVLASTPIFTVHAALGGYMDLWMSGYLMLAVLGLAYVPRMPAPWTLLAPAAHTRLRWWAEAHPMGLEPIGWASAHLRARARLPRLLLFVIPPLFVKIEGAVWVALLLLALALLRNPRVTIAIGAVGLLAVLAIMFLPDAGLRLFGERIVLAPDFVRIPYLGESPLATNPLLMPVWRALFATETFGVSFFVLVAGLVLAATQHRIPDPGIDARTHGLVVRFSWLALAFVVVLFGFTLAGKWAVDQTSLSRVIMQLVPIWLIAIAPALQRALAPQPQSLDAAQ